MPEERLIRRRLFAKDKDIASVKPEIDVRVRLTGTVIDTGQNSVVIDDGTGKAEVIFEEQPQVNQGQLVRVITRILPLIDGFQFRGELLQRLNGFDIKLYKKAKDLIKRGD